MSETLLEVKNLSCGYGDRPVLNGVDLAVREGESVLLAGPNGCGKSTFLKAVIGALPPDEEARARVFAGLLHAQYCFSESCGFCFGVDEDDTFVLLQALVDTDRIDESAFVSLMDKFVKTANVWTQRLAEVFSEPSETEPPSAETGDASS